MVKKIILAFLFLLPLGNIFAFEQLLDGDYHVTAGYRACIACHVYRGDPSTDCIGACGKCVAATIAFVNFPKTLNAGQPVDATTQLLPVDTARKASNVMLVDGKTGLNIKDVGWSVVQDPAGHTANFLLQTPAQYLSVFKLLAPQVPGTYILEVALHGSGCFAPLNNIFIRYDYDTVTVNAVSEAVPPSIAAAAAAFARTVLVLFSEPVQTAEAKTAANYQLTKTGGGNVAIDSVSLSLDRKKATLYTAGALENTKSYTITVNNVKDFAQTPNVIAANASKTFTVNRRSVFSLFPGIGMDAVSGNVRMLRPQLNFVGRADSAGNMYRALERWDISALPPGESIQSVKLVMQQDTAIRVSTPVGWDVIHLGDTVLSHWVINYINTGGGLNWFWSGLNSVASPAATVNAAVQTNTPGVSIPWEWDITTDFKNAYVQRQRVYALRIKLANEAATAPGVRFYSGMFVDTTKLPRLIVTLDTATAGVELNSSRPSAGVQLTASPNPFKGVTTITARGGAGLNIYDLRGRRTGSFSVPPEGNIHWRAADGTGRPLAPGIYLARLSKGMGNKILRLAVLP